MATRFCRQKDFDQMTKLKLVEHFQKLGKVEANKYADLIVGDLTDVSATEKRVRQLTGLSVDLSNYQDKKPARRDDPVHMSPKKVFRLAKT